MKSKRKFFRQSVSEYFETFQCAIITYKHGMSKLPHELPNDLRLRKD